MANVPQPPPAAPPAPPPVQNPQPHIPVQNIIPPVITQQMNNPAVITSMVNPHQVQANVIQPVARGPPPAGLQVLQEGAHPQLPNVRRRTIHLANFPNPTPAALSTHDDEVFRATEAGSTQADIHYNLQGRGLAVGPYWGRSFSPPVCPDPRGLSNRYPHMNITELAWSKIGHRAQNVAYDQCIPVFTYHGQKDHFFPLFLHTRPTYFGALSIPGLPAGFQWRSPHTRPVPAAGPAPNPPTQPDFDDTRLPNLWYVSGIKEPFPNTAALNIPDWYIPARPQAGSIPLQQRTFQSPR